MISMGSVGGAGAAASYYTKDNYYTDRDAAEASGWVGVGADAAGLEGPVDEAQFKALLEGRLPDGSLVPAALNGAHAAGMDMTFSAPKSLSLLAYVGGDTRLLEANMAAVKSTLAWAEKNLAETRISKNGKVETVKTGNLVVALFSHDTSRNLDPQAHVHAVIANATQDRDGKWRALHNGKLWEHNALLGSIYHAQLRANVEALGYTIGTVGKHGRFEIAGVPRDAIETFSTRRAEILATAAEKLDHSSPQGLSAVALRTRQAKPDIEDRGALRAEWRERAAAIGLDLAPVIDAAAARRAGETRPHTGLDRLTQGIRAVADRAAAVALHLRDRLGLRPAELDPFMPAGSDRLRPGELAAATAVAAAIRQLSERETSFTPAELSKAALDLGLPVTIAAVERATRVLVASEQLQRHPDQPQGRLTTPQAVASEQRILAEAEAGRGSAAPVIASPDAAGMLLQAAAQARSGLTLNAGQESAGRLLLASGDRIVNVQGVAGSGKSSALAAVAEVARSEGRNVLALGPQNTLVRALEADAGITAMTIAKFLYTHERLLSDKTFAERLGHARAMFKGAVILVDESSMASNEQVLKLTALANRLEVGRLAFIGDHRQLGAVDAGKPFELLQAAGVATATMDANLRQRTPLLREAAALANAGQPGEALALLRGAVHEAPGRMSDEAAARWLALPPDTRAETLLIASGRTVRAELNQRVQQGLVAEGSLGNTTVTLPVIDRINLTREEERLIDRYRPGQHIAFGRAIKDQNIAAGAGQVTAVDRAAGVVEIRRDDGRLEQLRPEQLSTRRRTSSLELGERRDLEVHAGETIRWTTNDLPRGLLNAARATVTGINADGGLRVRNAAGVEATLAQGDPMLARLDLGYAMNTHMLQGATADRAIGVMDSRETRLANGRLFLVNITRVRDHLELVVDDAGRIERALGRNPGDKTAALDTLGIIDLDSLKLDPRLPRDNARSPPAAEPARQAALPLREPLPQEPAHVQPLERVIEKQPDFGL